MVADDLPIEMEPELHALITRLSGEGDALADEGRYREAVEKYEAALHLVPEPKVEWDASTWLLAAIGDALFLWGQFSYARMALEDAMHCPGAIGNPFLHLRLGQALLEQGEEDRAADELMRAYMLEGRDIFERQDPKYLAFLATRAMID